MASQGTLATKYTREPYKTIRSITGSKSGCTGTELPCGRSKTSIVTPDKKFKFKPITEVEVFYALSHTSPYRSSAGLLPNKVLRKTAEVTTQSLTLLFNRSLREGIFHLLGNWLL